MAIVFEGDLTLRLPDGTTVGYHPSSCSRAQIHAPKHGTATGGVACFLVTAPVSGTYTFLWENNEKGALSFSIG
jgi:hypothetical protein